MKDGVDKGFCISYRRLSNRRKFRTTQRLTGRRSKSRSESFLEVDESLPADPPPIWSSDR